MNYYQKWGRISYRILYITTLAFCILFFKQNVEAATSNYSVYPVQDKDGCNATKVCAYKTFYVNFWNLGDANQQFKSTTATIKKNGKVVKTVTRTANNYMNWSNADFYLTEAGNYSLERSAVTTKGSTLNWDATDMYVYQPSALGSINASSSSISLSITGTNSKTITLSQSGICPDKVYLNYSISNSNVSCSWGNWNDAGTSCPLTITGKYGGTDKVTVSMYESSSKTLVSTTTISVTIGPNYTVSYNANGGSGAPSSQIKNHGVTLTLSTTKPSRTGYEFLGWSTSSNATRATYSAGGSYTSNSNATLYAVWKRITYTVSYNANGGSGAPSSQTKYHGTTLTLSTTKPSRTGYEFLGWSTSRTASAATYRAGDVYSENGDVVLYAVWIIWIKNEQTEADKKAADSVTQKINSFDANNRSSVEATRKAYNSLTPDQKKHVSAATLKKLTDAEAALKKAQTTTTNSSQTTTVKKNQTSTAKKKQTKKAKTKKKALNKRGVIISVKSKKKYTLIMKWKKIAGITGYEFQVSRNKKFKNKGRDKLRYNRKVSHDTLDWQSGIWFIRMRPYKKIGKAKIYGKWSKVKKVKVK